MVIDDNVGRFANSKEYLKQYLNAQFYEDYYGNIDEKQRNAGNKRHLIGSWSQWVYNTELR